MSLDVMNYMAAAIRQDFKKVVELSMECVMCGLCAVRCPAELAPFNVAMLIRRLYAIHMVPPSPQLHERLTSIRSGAYDSELESLKIEDSDSLKERFKEYQATKGAAV
jgi:heterodisulfide reductase subunit C